MKVQLDHPAARVHEERAHRHQRDGNGYRAEAAAGREPAEGDGARRNRDADERGDDHRRSEERRDADDERYVRDDEPDEGSIGP